VDAFGNPVLDPTRNVRDLVEAAIMRQDDLRAAESRHVREITSLRAEYQQELRKAETERIDAIRAVDVGAVQRAAEVQATQAAALAAQVAASAEAMRTQVAAAATAAQTSLSAALVPIQDAIADLRRAQYEAQGQKTQVVEAQTSRSGIYAAIGAVAALLVIGLTVVALVVGK
jgi:TolA-binding protein